MAGRIQFNEDTYNHVIGLLGGLETGLRAAASGPAPLRSDIEVQPPPQTWAPAKDLVEATRQHFAAMADWNDTTAAGVGALQQSFEHARTVLRDAEDLALVSAERFAQAINR